MGVGLVLSNILKLVFYLTSFAPVGLAFSFVMYQQQNISCALKSLALSTIFIIVGYLIFFFGKAKCISYTLKVDSLQDESKALFVYVVTYILPLVTLVFKDLNINNAMLFAFIALIMAIVYFTNMRFVNPLLFILGYKFYLISIEQGISSLLVSRAKYRSCSDIKTATRLFEGIFIN